MAHTCNLSTQEVEAAGPLKRLRVRLVREIESTQTHTHIHMCVCIPPHTQGSETPYLAKMKKAKDIYIQGFKKIITSTTITNIKYILQEET